MFGACAFIDNDNVVTIPNCKHTKARVSIQSPQLSHSVPILKSHHWLPIKYHIIVKLCTIACQTLSSGEPSCLFYMLSLVPKPREPHFHLLSVLRVKTHAGTHTFSVVVPTLWNSHSLTMLTNQIAYFFPSPFESSPFQTCFSLLGFRNFHCIQSFVNEFFIAY